MRLYKRGHIWWCWYYDTTGAKQCVSTRCIDRKAAEAIAKEFERQTADPSYAASKTYSLESCLSDFLAFKKESGSAKGTLQIYEQKSGTLARLLGAGLLLSDLNAKVLDEYLQQRLSEGVTKNTVSKELITLSGALKLAKRHGHFAGEVKAILPVKWSSDYKPRQTYLTVEQALGLLEHLEPERAAHVSFMFGSAARRTEAVRARRGDIDLKGGIVRIRESKTRKAITEIPIVAMTRPFLERVLRDAPGDDLLFRSWNNGRRDILRACERAGVPPVTYNDLRRSLATWLVQSGVPLQHISKVLRHKTTVMVERVYGVMSTKALGNLIEASMSKEKAL